MKQKAERGLYIAIEGLDGSGKSTLVDNLSCKLSHDKRILQVARPTKSIEGLDSLLERINMRYPTLSRNDIFRIFLYAERSRNATRHIDWSKGLILGDRSIVTSYATRWRRILGSRQMSLLLVNIIESSIPAPDHILFLQLPLEDYFTKERPRPYCLRMLDTANTRSHFITLIMP